LFIIIVFIITTTAIDIVDSKEGRFERSTVPGAQKKGNHAILPQSCARSSHLEELSHGWRRSLREVFGSRGKERVIVDRVGGVQQCRRKQRARVDSMSDDFREFTLWGGAGGVDE
jgi:hypothetical protein